MASPAISPADRIRELSEINADVASMLHSASQAINTLTNRPMNAGENGDTHMSGENKKGTIEEREEAFTDHTKAYYTTLQAIVARLRRQAYALEEAGLIAAEAPTLSSGSQQKPALPNGRGPSAAAPVQDPPRLTNGGLGNLDVGWLNSRGNKVAAEKESELVQDAKKLLEDVLSREDVASASNGG